MPTHCNSDVVSTNCRDQAGSASKYGDVLEYPSHDLNLFINNQHRNRRKTQCRLDGCESLMCRALCEDGPIVRSQSAI
jgi:hypothetical protein